MEKQLKPLSLLSKNENKITYMKKYILTLMLGASLLFTANQLSAQPGFDDDVTDTPIDGGISLVMAAGLAYGATKLKKAKI